VRSTWSSTASASSTERPSGTNRDSPAAAAAAVATRLSDKDKAALGEGPEVESMRDDDVGEARAR